MLWQVDVPGPACWQPDRRRPSHIPEEHLNYAENGLPAWLGVAFEWSEELDPRPLTRAILGWVDRHEALRRRFAKDGPAITSATVGPGKSIVHRTELGYYIDRTELAR